MKILKKLLGFLAAVLILGGLIVLGFEYIRNKTTFNILFNNSVVKGTLPVLKNMGISVIAVIICCQKERKRKKTGFKRTAA